MKLVSDWREAWRWFSVQALAVLVALPLVWASLPSDLKAFVPDGWERWILIAVAAAGLIGRVIDQQKPAPAPPEPLLR